MAGFTRKKWRDFSFPVHLSRAVFELEQRKWLTRTTNEADRRVEHLQSTKAESVAHAKLAVQAQHYQQKLLTLLGNAKVCALIAVLDQLNAVFANQDMNQP